MKLNRLLLPAVLLLSTTVFSQTIQLRSGTFAAPENIRRGAVDSFNTTAKRTANQAFAVLQFKHIPSAAEQKALTAAGIQLLDYIAANSYTVSITGALSVEALQAVGAKAIFQLTPHQKMQEGLANGNIPAYAVKTAGTIDVWVSIPKTLPAITAIAELQKAGVEIISTTHQRYGVLALRINNSRLTEIAAFPFIEYLQAAPAEDQPLNYNSRAGAAANLLNSSVADGGRGLNGEGMVIGVGDNADLQNHPDLKGRTIHRNVNGFNAHGLHVAGTTAGAGIIEERHRGYAPKATVISSSFSSILDNAPAYVADYGMAITNNSYGNGNFCSAFGVYDLYSRILDQQSHDMPNLLHVFAAGNSGGSACAPYPTGFRTVFGSYQSAKNVLTVGATEADGNLAGFSARGPVRDGRLKPEITSMGSGVISAWPTNIYSINFGTSMASPGVSGGLALLYQRYKQLNGGANPKNGLMKALLCNGGRDKGNAGPDFGYGYGWMNLWRSVQMMEAANYTTANSANASTADQTITVPAGTAQLKVMLYWNDAPASILSSKALVNDLDLEVLTPAASTVLPQILDTAISALTTPSTTGADHVNNMEQVIINNPAAGSYKLTVKGTTVTTPSQEYFLVWDAIPAGLKLTSPAGGEAFFPGETAKINWDAYGLSGTCNLEYSTDGGVTWNVVSGGTGINLTTAVFNWTIPTVASNNVIVRATKTGTGETSVSNAFTVIGRPTLSLAAIQCEGYAAIEWTTVTGATDYEVMLLKDGAMQSVAITAGTSYTFSGLNKDSVYWFGVRARLSGKPGLRAVAIARQPNSGTCSGSISDNDLVMDAITAPTSGRQFTSSALSTAQTVSVRIKNLDDAAISNFNVAYTVNGGAAVTETVTASVAAGATYTHNFSVTTNMAATGNYTIMAWVQNPPDVVRANDTATRVVKHIANAPLNLTTAFTDGFETATTAEYEADTIGLGGIERYDFNRTTAYGRARTFVNSSFARSGMRAVTLDVSRLVPSGNISYLYGTYNLSNYSASVNDLRLDFHYLNHHQAPNPANRVWIRGSESQPWVLAYDLDQNLQDPGLYKRSTSIEISNLLAAAGQTLTPSVGVRWGQWGQAQAADPVSAAGLTFDDIRVYEVFNDVQTVKIDAPASNSCGLSSATQVRVSVRNASTSSLTNVPVYYRLNGGAIVSETVPSLAPLTTMQYTFTTTANFGTPGAYTLQAWVSYGPDSFRENDTATVIINNQPIISSYPYLQNFESGAGNFYSAGTNNSWAYGTPASAAINKAASGSKAWKTRLSGNYNDNETSYLYTPCFNVSGLTAPTLSFSVAMDIEDCGSSLCDAAWVEYSTDGEAWTKLGNNGAGTNWYNSSAYNVWSVQSYTWWHVATQALPTGASALRLRFAFASDPGVTREGIAIDDVHVYDNPAGIYDGVTMASPVSQLPGSTGWTDFLNGGKLVASLNPAGAVLGSTNAQAYIHTGTVRNINNQYYHHRNITIQPANNTLPDSVSVRFYFLDSETEALRAATGCGSCPAVGSAYDLGVSKYTDATKANENGTVADNSSGTWQFIAPAGVTKVPFDKGYYAEFKVAGFSEFWLSRGSLGNITVLPVRLLNFDAVKRGTDVEAEWKVAADADVVRYEVELAAGNAALTANSFIKIGELRSGGAGTQTYRFTDAEPGKRGVRYYRLKVISTNGSFIYSDIKPVLFSDAAVWQVYPNPSLGKFNLQYQAAPGEWLQARVLTATGSLVREYRTPATGFLQKLTVDLSAGTTASGLYILQVDAGGAKQTFKLYKQ